jgi:hypothetical protein
MCANRFVKMMLVQLVRITQGGGWTELAAPGVRAYDVVKDVQPDPHGGSGTSYPLMIAINAAVKGAGSRSPRIASCWL